MPRSVRSRIETRSARLRLPGRKDPYWQKIERGLSVGYHRPMRGGTGAWWGRKWLGDSYRVEALAQADDHQDANGQILDWAGAQAAVRAWAGRIGHGGPYTVADAVRAYITDLRARKGDKAAREAEGRLRKYLLPGLGHKQLADVTAGDVRDWLNSMVTCNASDDEVRRSRDSANRVLGMAKAAFNLAFNSGLVADDRPWRRVKAFRGVGEARKVLLSDDDLQLLVDACPPGLRELVMIGALTGARLGELTARRVRDLDLAAGTLAVDGKTGPRELPLSPAALALLRQMVRGKRADAWLFPTATGGRWTGGLHTRPFKAAVERAGIDPATVFYSLRHTWISRALLAGAPTRLVAEMAGTSVVMIERSYAKFLATDRHKYAALAAPQLRIANV